MDNLQKAFTLEQKIAERAKASLQFQVHEQFQMIRHAAGDQVLDLHTKEFGSLREALEKIEKEVIELRTGFVVSDAIDNALDMLANDLCRPPQGMPMQAPAAPWKP